LSFLHCPNFSFKINSISFLSSFENRVRPVDDAVAADDITAASAFVCAAPHLCNLALRQHRPLHQHCICAKCSNLQTHPPSDTARRRCQSPRTSHRGRTATTTGTRLASTAPVAHRQSVARTPSADSCVRPPAHSAPSRRAPHTCRPASHEPPHVATRLRRPQIDRILSTPLRRIVCSAVR
jgi:hypothetical protein